jgi:hypothetical protein
MVKNHHLVSLLEVDKVMTGFLDGKKTYIVSTLAFLIVLAQAIIDTLNGQQVNLQLLFEAMIALAMVFLRQGVSKVKGV